MQETDERASTSLDRGIDGDWGYLWLGATYLRMLAGGRIVPVAATIATAVNSQGRCEIVGVGPSGSRAIPAKLPSMAA